MKQSISIWPVPNRKILYYLLLFAALLLPSAVGLFHAAGSAFRILLLRALAAAGMLIFLAAVPRIRRIVLLLLYQGFGLLELTSLYLSGRSFGYEFFFHFNASGLREGFQSYLPHLAAAVLFLAISGILAFLAGKPCRVKQKKYLLVLLLPAAAALFFSPAAEFWKNRARNSAASAGIGPDPVKRTRLDASQVTATSGKNLLILYLESFEAAYLDEEKFPGLAENLRKLREEGLVFDQLEQSDRAHFTFGSLYASQTGSELTGLQLSRGHNDGLNPAIGDRLATLPGILGKAGYFNSFMQSNSLAFAGTNVLLKYLSYQDAWSASDLPENIKKQFRFSGDWGGCRDRVLLFFALQKLRLLARDHAPFQLTVMTIDTHHPSGFHEPGSRHYPGSQSGKYDLRDALYNTDRAVGEFIAALKKEPYWKDLTVVILSDHLSMPSADTHPVLAKIPHRKLLAFALNCGRTGHIATPGKTYDLAPTILTLAGVRHNWIFPLGEDLVNNPAPPALRLEADQKTKLPFLENYLLEKSSLIPPGAAAAVSREPFDSILLGNVRVPLFGKAFGEQCPLQKGELFVIRIDRAHRLRDAIRLTDEAETLEKLLQKEAREFILYANDSKLLKKYIPDAPAGISLFRGTPGKWHP